MAELKTLARVAFRLAAHSPPPSDDDLLARLLDLGIDRATARRIVVFAPVAAARVAYRDLVTFVDADRYYLQSTASGRTAHLLSEEPVFSACVAVAKACSRARREPMLRRSATFDSVTAARQTNPELKGLQVGAPTILQDGWPEPSGSAPPSWARSLRLWWLSYFG
jgi:hypothetical protein